MVVKTFSASNTEAAFARIKDTLGQSAVILEVRRTARGVDVLAAPGGAPGSLRRMYELGRSGYPMGTANDRPRRGQGRGLSRGKAGITQDSGYQTPGHMMSSSPVRDVLESIDFPSDLCARLGAVSDRHDLPWRSVTAWLEQCYPPLLPTEGASADQRGIALGFVGPQGVGRSSLVRGLATRAAIADPGRIVWVRVGFPRRRLPHMEASEAPIGVDLRMAHSLAELRSIADDHQDCDALLLDLPGIDVHSSAERAALHKFVREASRAWRRVVWHSVVPATWSAREATRTLNALAPLGIRGTAWTCLDLAADPGTIVAATLRTELRPAFLHGDRIGDGGSTRTASWEELVGQLEALGLEEAVSERAIAT